MPGVETGRDDDQLRLEMVHGRRQQILKGEHEFLSAGAAGHRAVEVRAQTLAAARFLLAAGPGIPGELVRAEVEHRAVFIEDVLRAVAVVHVPVDNQHLAQMVLALCIAGGDGGVVEHAEAHAAMAVAWCPGGRVRQKAFLASPSSTASTATHPAPLA